MDKRSGSKTDTSGTTPTGLNELAFDDGAGNKTSTEK